MSAPALNVPTPPADWAAERAALLAFEVLGARTPPWEPSPEPRSPSCPLLEEFAEHLARHRGNPPVTSRKDLAHITAFLAFLRSRQGNRVELDLADIDAFIVAYRPHYARTTVADMASSLRGFLRFLHITRRLAVDLAPSVMAPIVRRDERPLRALPWEKVQRILGAIDRSTAAGRRDYALLLLMSVYGLGAGPVLRLEDIDWHAGVLHVTRPKTGVALPLLPAVARVLGSYLRHGRPQHAGTRHRPVPGVQASAGLLLWARRGHAAELPAVCASPDRCRSARHSRRSGSVRASPRHGSLRGSRNRTCSLSWTPCDAFPLSRGKCPIPPCHAAAPSP